MKILITGNAGFIGGYLTGLLVRQGHEIVGLDKNPVNPQSAVCHCVTGNILNREDVLKAMSGTELVINLAAEHKDFGISRELYFEVNQLGTRTLLECATESGINKFLLYSSVAVYKPSPLPVTEDSPTLPATDYGESKLAAEGEVIKWHQESQDRTAIILRPTVVYGPKNTANMYRLIDTIYRRRFLRVGSLLNIKSITYVENLVAATAFLIARQQKELINCTYVDEPQMPTIDIVRHIATCLEIPSPRVVIPLQLAIPLASTLDLVGRLFKIDLPITANRIRKLNTQTMFQSDRLDELGFRAEVTNKEGLRRMVDWYRQQL
jgi:GlcNAc-P-P-Und epimerase